MLWDQNTFCFCLSDLTTWTELFGSFRKLDNIVRPTPTSLKENLDNNMPKFWSGIYNILINSNVMISIVDQLFNHVFSSVSNYCQWICQYVFQLVASSVFYFFLRKMNRLLYGYFINQCNKIRRKLTSWYRFFKWYLYRSLYGKTGLIRLRTGLYTGVGMHT